MLAHDADLVGEPDGAAEVHVDLVRRVLHFDRAGTLTVRVDVINVRDQRYEIRDGTGVGVGAPQYGPRRGVFVGVSKSI